MPCNIEERIRKYYFGYHEFNGIAYAFKWAEDDGVCVGGRPNLVGPKVEITHEQFKEASTRDLEKEHPFVYEIPLMFPSSSKEPNST